ncbi:MAG TPA: hypothetical protein VFE60_04565 [Roseiarcus sp.]|jgi:hypothetical protein|nr:hypothetical protein [Roseiarcus sp.]
MIRGIRPAYGKKLVLAAAFAPNAWRFVGLARASKTRQLRLWFQLHPGNDCLPHGLRVALKTLAKLGALPEYSGTGSQDGRRDGRQVANCNIGIGE